MIPFRGGPTLCAPSISSRTENSFHPAAGVIPFVIFKVHSVLQPGEPDRRRKKEGGGSQLWREFEGVALCEPPPVVLDLLCQAGPRDHLSGKPTASKSLQLITASEG